MGLQYQWGVKRERELRLLSKTRQKAPPGVAVHWLSISARAKPNSNLYECRYHFSNGSQVKLNVAISVMGAKPNAHIIWSVDGFKPKLHTWTRVSFVCEVESTFHVTVLNGWILKRIMPKFDLFM